VLIPPSLLPLSPPQRLFTAGPAVVAAMTEFIMDPARPDWPKPGPLDLAIEDLPHCTASTEWWYYNSHFTCSGAYPAEAMRGLFSSGRVLKCTAVCVRVCA
jgi:hypothetical protein